MNISHRQLKMFVMLAKELNFTHAAKKLYVSQPAISMQIKQLENELGLPLFEYLGKKMYLTEAGKATLQYAQKVILDLNELDSAINDLKGIKRGHLTLVVANSLSYLAAQIMGDFLQEYPEIDISLEVGNRTQQIDKLANNSIDLAIMGAAPPDLKVTTECIVKTEIIPVAAPSHPLVNEKNLTLDNLSKERFLYGEPGSGTRVAMDRSIGQKHMDHNHIEVSNNEMVKHCIQSGIGIGLLPKNAIEVELENNLLVPLDVVNFPIPYQVNIVHSSEKQLSLVAKLFKKLALNWHVRREF